MLSDSNEMNLRVNLDDSPVDRARKRVERGLGQMARHFQGLALSANSYLARIAPRLEQITQSAERMATSLRNAGLALTLSTTVGLGGFLAVSAKAQAAYETNAIAFETITGSAQTAMRHLRDLEKFASETPFSNKELIELSTFIQAVGWNVNDVIPTLRTFGDAAAALGGGDKLGRILQQIGQIRSNMRATGQDMMALSSAGLPVWDMLSEKLGETIATVRKKVSEGAIDGETVIRALMESAQERYGGLMEKIAQTTAGKFSNIQDKLFLIAKDIGQILDPYLKSALNVADQLLERMQQVVEAFKALPQKTKDDIVTLLTALVAIGPALLVVAGGAQAFAMLAAGIKPVVAAVGLLSLWFSKITVLLGGLMSGGLASAFALTVIRTAAIALAKPLAIVAAALAGLAVGYILLRHWREVVGLLIAIWNDLYKATSAAGRFIMDVWRTAAQAFIAVWKAAFGIITAALGIMAKLVMDAIRGIFGLLAKLGEVLGKWFTDNFKETQEAWGKLKEAVVGGFKSVEAGSEAATQGGKKVAAAVSEATDNAKELQRALTASRAALFEAQIGAKPPIIQDLERMKALLAQLRAEGLLTTEVLANYTQAWGLRLRSFFQDAAKDARTAAVQEAEQWRRMQDEQRMKDMQRVQEFRNETLRIEVDGLQEQLDRQSTILDQQRQAEIRAVEAMRTDTIEGQVAQINAKLAIDQRYFQQKLLLDQQEMTRVYEAARFELELKEQLYADDVEMLKAIHARKLALEANYQARMKGLSDDTAAAIAAAGQEAANSATAAVNQHQQRVFDSLKQQAGGIFDALTQRSQSVWSAIANSFKTAMLTAIKEIVTSQIALSLMQLLYGTGTSGVQGKGMGGTIAPMSGGGLLGSAGILGGLLGGRAGAPDGSAGRPFYVIGSGSGGGLQGLAGLGAGVLPGGAAATATPGFAGGGGAADILGGGGGGLAGALGGTFKLPTGGLLGKGAIGGQLGSGLVLGGGMLAMMGLQRGGMSGALMAAGGGALIGAKFGGPIGAAIGAGVGLGAGLIRNMFKGGTDKVRSAVQQVYGVRMTDKGMLQQIADMAKQSFGGNINAAVRSPEVRRLVELYALSTGQRMGISPESVNSFAMVQSNGQIYQALQYQQGRSFALDSSLPVMGTPSQVVGSGSTTLQLDGPATVALLRGEVATGIRSNSQAVARAVNQASHANVGRREGLALNLSPGTLTA